MATQSYNLEFEGYLLEPDKGDIPSKSGIYCVYSGSCHRYSRIVKLHKLVYIGESEDVRERIADHEKWADWRRHLRPGEQIALNFAPIVSGRERAEAAMINRHKPPENAEYVDEFPYDRTTITTSGDNTLLDESFTVETSR